LEVSPHEAAEIHHPRRPPFASRQTRRLPATVCILIPMDWLILILGVPAILIPLVLLFGFAGCTAQAPGLCADDSDCPVGTQCVEGLCIAVDDSPPSAPENLAAIALDDHRVSLTWNNTDPRATDISFQIERARENGEPVATPVQANLSPTGAASATDAFSLEEGVTFIYRVRAVLGEQVSDPSNESLATVFPAAPVNLVATPVSVNQIDLSWTNASATATEFSLEVARPGARSRKSSASATLPPRIPIPIPASLRERRINTASSPSSQPIMGGGGGAG